MIFPFNKAKEEPYIESNIWVRIGGVVKLEPKSSRTCDKMNQLRPNLFLFLIGIQCLNSRLSESKFYSGLSQNDFKLKESFNIRWITLVRDFSERKLFSAILALTSWLFTTNLPPTERLQLLDIGSLWSSDSCKKYWLTELNGKLILFPQHLVSFNYP